MSCSFHTTVLSISFFTSFQMRFNFFFNHFLFHLQKKLFVGIRNGRISNQQPRTPFVALIPFSFVLNQLARFCTADLLSWECCLLLKLKCLALKFQLWDISRALSKFIYTNTNTNMFLLLASLPPSLRFLCCCSREEIKSFTPVD